jgi:hypothetical protein
MGGAWGRPMEEIEGNKALGRSSSRREDFKRALKKEDVMVLTGFFSALTNMKMKFRFPQNAWNLLTSWGTVSFSRRSVLCGVNYAIDRYINLEKVSKIAKTLGIPGVGA